MMERGDPEPARPGLADAEAIRPDPNGGGWDALARRHGTPFHARAFCEAIAAHWPGRVTPRHACTRHDGRIIGLVSAYGYDDCPRLDYYRHATSEPLLEPVVLSHTLVGWCGGPLGVSREAMSCAVHAFAARACEEHAIAMFAGIDERDAMSIDVLVEHGFVLRHWHTDTVRPLDPERDRDPLAALRSHYRSTRKSRLRAARNAGLVCRAMQPSDEPTILDLLGSTLTHRAIQADILPAAFLRAIFSSFGEGLDVVVAATDADEPIGVSVNFVWDRAYYTWVRGHRRDAPVSHAIPTLLYDESIRRAADAGCREIRAGRTTYKPKFEFGFRPLRLLAAVKGGTAGRHQRAVVWLDALARRHRETYPDVHSPDHGVQEDSAC